MKTWTVDLAYTGPDDSVKACKLEGVLAQNKQQAAERALSTMHEPGNWDVLGVHVE